MKVKRRIEIENIGRETKYEEWQALYKDRATGELIADTEIWEQGRVVMRINSLGCKGEELLPNVPVIAFFGDSTVFGVGMLSWPNQVRVPGFQCLNAGMEGAPLEQSLRRFRKLSEQVPLAAAVIVPGWHNMFYGRTGDHFWRSALDQFAGDHLLAVCSIATCLTDECKQRGLDALYCKDEMPEGANYFEHNLESMNSRYFNFWGDIPGTRENIAQVMMGVDHYNGFIKEYCASKGRQLIDLNGLLRPQSYEEIPRDFFDVCHFRPRVYGRIGSYVAEQLQQSLTGRMPAGAQQQRGGAAQEKKDFPHYDLRKQMYPIW